MNQFGSDINFIHSTISLAAVESDYTYFTYMLNGEDQARLFRVHHEHITPATLHQPPTSGRFVSAAVMPMTGQLILAYCEFPEGGGESQQLGALGYDSREMEKAPRHVAEYLINGTVPTADGEYDPAPQPQ